MTTLKKMTQVKCAVDVPVLPSQQLLLACHTDFAPLKMFGN